MHLDHLEIRDMVPTGLRVQGSSCPRPAVHGNIVWKWLKMYRMGLKQECQVVSEDYPRPSCHNVSSSAATHNALVLSVLSVYCTKGRSASSYRFATNVAAAPRSDVWKQWLGSQLNKQKNTPAAPTLSLLSTTNAQIIDKSLALCSSTHLQKQLKGKAKTITKIEAGQSWLLSLSILIWLHNLHNLHNLHSHRPRSQRFSVWDRYKRTWTKHTPPKA